MGIKKSAIDGAGGKCTGAALRGYPERRKVLNGWQRDAAGQGNHSDHNVILTEITPPRLV